MNVPDPARPIDSRVAPRASLYLAASLQYGEVSCGVKIRNISSTGALLEGAASVQAGAVVNLVRGSLKSEGVIAWTSGGKCGLHFSREVDVEKWRASFKNPDQHRVDELVGVMKSGSPAVPVIAKQSVSTFSNINILPADLRRVWDLLEHLGNKLAKDGIVIAQYSSDLQNLDIAMQIISAVEAILLGSGMTLEDAKKLANLRKSADRALCRN